MPDASSPIPAQVAGPIGAQFRPTNSSQLYVTNAHGGPGPGSVSAFNVNLFGHLTPIGSSPFANFQTASCWVEISHDGRYLFSVNTASATISRYSINRDGSLVLLGSTPFNNGLGAVDARLSPDGKTLAVTGGRGQVVSMFAVSGGTSASCRAPRPRCRRTRRRPESSSPERAPPRSLRTRTPRAAGAEPAPAAVVSDRWRSSRSPGS